MKNGMALRRKPVPFKRARARERPEDAVQRPPEDGLLNAHARESARRHRRFDKVFHETPKLYYKL
jgi:hypothetical protein